MAVTEPGFYVNMDPGVYYADPAPEGEVSFNQTLGKVILAESPASAKYLHPRLNPNLPTEEKDRKLERARATHRLLLGKGAEIAVIEFMNYATKAAQAERESAYKAKKIPLVRPDYEQAAAMVLAAQGQLAAIDRHAFDSDYGYSEMCVICQDPAGIWTRALIDWYGDRHPDGVICWDFKTTDMSANPDTIKWHANRQGWAFQAAFQERIIGILRPKLAGAVRFRFLVQENKPPYLCSAVEPDPGAMVVARKMAAAAIGLWKACLVSGSWPGYPASPRLFQVLPGTEAAWLEREYDPALRALMAADPVLNAAAPEPSKDDLPDLESVPADMRKRRGRTPLTAQEKAARRAARDRATAESAKGILAPELTKLDL